ncbi:MAG: hypothetical protein QW046_02900 [Candidatus Micrarchaeaceae archaeon]
MLEEYMLKPGDRFFLVYPNGFVPLAVTAVDRPFTFIYDPIVEGSLTPIPASSSAVLNGIRPLNNISDQQFGSTYITGNPNNVFTLSNKQRLYQVFFGVSPSYTRVFYYFPATTQQGAMDVGVWSSNYFQFGFIDGFQSPFDDPSPLSEFVVPYGAEPAFTLVNPVTVNIAPLFNFFVNRAVVTLIKDANVVYDMFTSNTKKLVVGGLSSFQTNQDMMYGLTTPINPAQVLGQSQSDAISYLQGVLS